MKVDKFVKCSAKIFKDGLGFSGKVGENEKLKMLDTRPDFLDSTISIIQQITGMSLLGQALTSV